MARRPSFLLLTGILLLAAAWPRPAAAQLVFEAAGERALGMGGAFVAVADDATAAHWNPAGLVAGQPAGATIGWHRFRVGDDASAPTAGLSWGQSSLTSLGTWPLGLSYGTLGRQWVTSDAGTPRGHTLRVSHLGVTVLQSITSNVVVGSTLKFMRGRAASAGLEGETAGEAFDHLRALDADGHMAFDLDLGLLVMGRIVSVGVVSKNLRSPEFGDTAESAIALPQQTRAGVSVRPVAGLTLALDVDLNTVDLMGDDRQMLAAGGEVAVGPRVRIRTGARTNLARSGQLTGAIGASIAVRTGMWIDTHYSRGRQSGSRELGVALRAGF